MRTTRQLSITLPVEMAEALRDRVSSGQYASESEAIRDGLRTLFARDQAVENWLQSEVSATYDALVTDPGRGIDAASIRKELAAKHAAREAEQTQR